MNRAERLHPSGGSSLPTKPGSRAVEVRSPEPSANPPEPAVWFRAAPVEAFPENGGGCVRVGDLQIAVFRFSRRGEWYACQNLCPHRKQMILSRGILGSAAGIPKIACPYHKRTFSLLTGACLDSELEGLVTYPVRIRDGAVFLGLPALPPGAPGG